LLGAALLLAAGGCSVLEPDKIDYKSSGRGVSLEVPPDLTQLPGQSRYAAQSGAVTASGYQAGQVATAAAGTPTAANKVADVQFMRQDGERWLRVDRAPDQLWGPVRDFWLESGFLMAIDQANMGPDGNRLGREPRQDPAGLHPQHHRQGVRFALFHRRARQVPHAAGAQRQRRHRHLTSAHRGMQEVYSSPAPSDSTVWQPRAARSRAGGRIPAPS
jgi:outer membrane protein assembly factor BamC